MCTGIVLYQPLINYLVAQAKNPTGLIGSMMTKIWSNYFQDLSRWSLRGIDLAKPNTVLDVGFGGGANIKYIKEHSATSIVYGIDISEKALQTATKLNQTSIDAREVVLALGDVAHLHFKDDFFDLIVATQTHIYWNSVKQGLTECYRVLRQGGNLLITCEIDKIAYHLSEYKNSDIFVSLLYLVGFHEVTVKVSNNYVAFVCTKYQT